MRSHAGVQRLGYIFSEMIRDRQTDCRSPLLDMLRHGFFNTLACSSILRFILRMIRHSASTWRIHNRGRRQRSVELRVR